jgi:hypothetical protein
MLWRKYFGKNFTLSFPLLLQNSKKEENYVMEKIFWQKLYIPNNIT